MAPISSLFKLYCPPPCLLITAICSRTRGVINKIFTYSGNTILVSKRWCRENNHGYARTAKEFREQLAGYLGGTFADVTTRQKGNTYYKNFTITEETKELYAKEYGYEETEFLAG